MFMGMDIVVEMRTKFTQLVRVGGVISGSSPSASKQGFLSHPHLAGIPMLVEGGLAMRQTNYKVHALGGSLRIIPG